MRVAVITDKGGAGGETAATPLCASEVTGEMTAPDMEDEVFRWRPGRRRMCRPS
jgi:hypothetical protein